MARVFRVFVSSTFSDLHAERNELQQKVYPRLQELCGKYGYRFQAVDLRWGVSREASMGNRTMQICIEELRRCQKLTPRPNFLVLLGDRYGWRPLPEQIPRDTFAALKTYLDAQNADRLLKAYTLDNNAWEPEYVLTFRPADETGLVDALDLATAQMNLLDDERIHYGASATHQEIYHGALHTEGADEHVFVFNRQFVNLPEVSSFRDAQDWLDVDTEGKRDIDAVQRLETLRNELRKRVGRNFISYPVVGRNGGHKVSLTFCDEVFFALGQVILSEIRHREKFAVESVEENHRFALEARLSCGSAFGYVSLPDVKKDVLAFLNADTLNVLAVCGPPGAGKSALMANTAAELAARWTVVEHYAGASGNSATGDGLLAYVNDRLTRLLNFGDPVEGETFKHHANRFHSLLMSCPPNRRLLVLIDGLDSLPPEDPARCLCWIPGMLPDRVKLIVSMDVPDSVRLPTHGCKTLPLPTLCSGEAEDILLHWEKISRRRLQDPQRAMVLAASDGRPLSLRMAFVRALRWRSFDPLPSGNHGLDGILESWRTELKHRHGSVLVETLFGLLASAREGMTEDELLCLLSCPDVIDEFRQRFPNSPQVAHLPVAPWIMLLAECEPLFHFRLSGGQETIAFVHEAIADILVPVDERTPWNERLLNFFSWPAGEAISAHTRRVLAERPFQLAKAGRIEEVEAFLLAADFVQARFRSDGVRALLSDFALARSGTVELCRRALSDAAAVLERSPKELAGQLHWRLQPTVDARIESLLAGLRKSSDTAWLNLHRISEERVSEKSNALVGHTREVTALAVLGRGILVSGAQDGTLRTWDVGDPFAVSRVTSYPDGTLLDMAVAEKESWLFTVSRRGIIRRWQIDGPFLSSGSAFEVSGVVQLAVLGEWVVALTNDARLLAWPQNCEKQTPSMESQLSDAVLPTRVLAVSGNDSVSITDGDGSVFSVHLTSDKFGLPQRLKHGAPEFRATALCTDFGGRLFTGCADGSIWNYAAKSGWSCLKNGSGDSIRVLTYDRDKGRLFAGTDEPMVYLFDLYSGATSEKPFNPGVGIVKALAIVNGVLAIAGEASQISLRVGQAALPAVTSLALDSRGRMGAAGDATGALSLYNLSALSGFLRTPVHHDAISAVEFSPKGKYVIAASVGFYKNGKTLAKLGLLDLSAPRPEIIYSPEMLGAVHTICWLPWSSSVLAVSDVDNQFVSYTVPELQKRDCRDAGSFHERTVTAITALQSEQETLVVSGSVSGKVVLCNYPDLTVLHEFFVAQKSVDILVSAGQHVAVGTRCGQVILYEIKDGRLKEIQRLETHPDAVSGLCLVGKRFILSACRDGLLRLWDYCTGGLVTTLTLGREITDCAGCGEVFLVGDVQGRVFRGNVDAGVIG